MDVSNRDHCKDIADADKTHREKYPSLITSKPFNFVDTSYQQEISKQYTVAVAYNKRRVSGDSQHADKRYRKEIMNSKKLRK